MSRVRVIGCGNPDAGDDALGLLAVRAARERLPGTVEVVEARSATRVIDLLADVDAVVLVDAVRSSAAVIDGRLIRLDAKAGEAPPGVRTSLSSHGLGLAEVSALAAAVGLRPQIVLLGLEADHTAMGSGLSPRVTAHLPALVDAVIHEVTMLNEGPVS